MTRTITLWTLALALLLAGPAQAQQYRFPTSQADYSEFYVTAYFDHGGLEDWNCGSDTYGGHNGNDYGVGGFPGMDAGRDVVAAAGGVVITSHDGEFDRCDTGGCAGGSGWGNHVFIQHPDGKTTIYAHLKQWSVAVAVNDVVACGDLLGEVGSSGNSTGPHIHFEVRNTNNTAVDPFLGTCSPNGGLWVAQGAYQDVPAATCDGAWSGCTTSGTLLCGDNLSTSNDGAGSTSDTVFYGCTEFTYTGPEQVWRFGTTLDEAVTLDLTGLSGDLDLFVLEDTDCDGSGCIVASTSPNNSDENLTFNATANTEYVVLVDGWEGATSNFNLAVGCQGGDPFATNPDAGVPDPDGSVPTDATVSTDASGVPGPDSGVATDAATNPPGPGAGGCACRSVGAGASANLVWLLLLAWLIRRRRRSH